MLVNIDVGMTQGHYNFGAAYLHQIVHFSSTMDEGGSNQSLLGEERGGELLREERGGISTALFPRAPLGEVLILLTDRERPADPRTEHRRQSLLDHKHVLTSTDWALPLRKFYLEQSAGHAGAPLQQQMINYNGSSYAPSESSATWWDTTTNNPFARMDASAVNRAFTTALFRANGKTERMWKALGPFVLVGKKPYSPASGVVDLAGGFNWLSAELGDDVRGGRVV